MIGCRSALVIAVALAACALPAAAQRLEFRDPSGNPRGYMQQEGNRSVLRDNSGNPHGYWQREGGWMVHRDNSGNLLGRAQIR